MAPRSGMAPVGPTAPGGIATGEACGGRNPVFAELGRADDLIGGRRGQTLAILENAAAGRAV